MINEMQYDQWRCVLSGSRRTVLVDWRSNMLNFLQRSPFCIAWILHLWFMSSKYSVKNCDSSRFAAYFCFRLFIKCDQIDEGLMLKLNSWILFLIMLCDSHRKLIIRCLRTDCCHDSVWSILNMELSWIVYFFRYCCIASKYYWGGISLQMLFIIACICIALSWLYY